MMALKIVAGLAAGAALGGAVAAARLGATRADDVAPPSASAPDSPSKEVRPVPSVRVPASLLARAASRRAPRSPLCPTQSIEIRCAPASAPEESIEIVWHASPTSP